MRFILTLIAVSISTVVNSTEPVGECDRFAERAFGQAALRGAVFNMLNDKGSQSPKKEMWKWLGLAAVEEYDALGISKESQNRIAKDISKAKFTKSFEADAFLIKEYYYAQCSLPSEYLKYKHLSKVKRGPMSKCWEGDAPQDGIRACVIKLVSKP